MTLIWLLIWFLVDLVEDASRFCSTRWTSGPAR